MSLNFLRRSAKHLTAALLVDDMKYLGEVSCSNWLSLFYASVVQYRRPVTLSPGIFFIQLTALEIFCRYGFSISCTSYPRG